MADEVESMMSARSTEWHGKANFTGKELTADEAIVAAGLDWQVLQSPVYTEYDGGQVVIPDMQAIVRDSDGTVLHVAGSKYQPIQNRDYFAFAETLLSEGVKFTTAGALRGGKRVFVCLAVPRTILVGGIEPVELYLLIRGSHDGSLAFGADIVTVVVVCSNTMTLAMQTAQSSWSAKHTAGAGLKMIEAREALGLTFAYADEWEATMNQLIETEMTKAEFERLVRDVFPHDDNKRGGFSREQYAMIGVLESSPNINADARYTQWGAINAITEHDQFGARYRDTGRDDDEKRLENALWGKSKDRADKVLSYLTA
jgi:phage/plasmid-like protein (TIGR03299 family)